MLVHRRTARGGITLLAGAFLALALADCVSGPEATGDGKSTAKEETLTKSDVVGTWGSDEKEQPNLTFNKDGSVTGTDGCNRLFGEWKIEDGSVVFTAMGTTQMACEDVDTWLSELDSATLDEEVLSIRDDDGNEIGTLKRPE